MEHFVDGEEIVQDLVTQSEREMLLRYCHRFTHDWSLAEDLTQQALLECWLKSEQLYGQEVRSSWLIGIARNICLRWLRSRKQEQTRIATMSDLPPEIETPFEDDVDIVEELERRELVQLVEKALALLPPLTRTVLVQCYLENVPQTEVAARLNMTIGAVEARLHRGKHALRSLLTHELREEATAYGLIVPAMTEWQDTHIWCPMCGQRRLLMQLPEPSGIISFRCPGCSHEPEDIGWSYPLNNARFARHVSGLTRPKPILLRIISWAYDYYYTAATHDGVVACPQCGQQRHLHLLLPAHGTETTDNQTERYGFGGQCSACGWQDYCSPAGLLQSLPEVQRFWHMHPRMRMIFHEQPCEADSQKASVASFESITDTNHIDIVFAQDTLKLIDIHTNVL